MKREVLRAPSVPIYMSLRNRNFPQHATVKAVPRAYVIYSGCLSAKQENPADR